MRKTIILALFVLALAPALAQEKTPFELGSDLYRKAKYDEAQVKFEEALRGNANDERIYLYLGVTYQRLNKFAKAIEVLQKGLLISVDRKPLFLFQIGNCYDEKGLADYAMAEKYFTLAITENNMFAEPYLNRGLIRCKFKRFKETVDDCKTYLKLYPDTPKRKEVEQLIAALEQDIAGQQRLIDSILSSLKNASADTRTDAAGTEGFKDTKTDGGDILD